MKLGIDARPLQHETQFRGIGKSLEFLLRALPAILEPSDKIVFYVDAGSKLPTIIELFPQAKVIEVTASKIARKRYIRSVLTPYRAVNPTHSECDVLLQYDATFGIPKTVPTVVIFHDLIPYLFRGKEKEIMAKGLRRLKNALAGSMYWQKYLRTLKTYKNAAHVVAISQSSQADYDTYVRKSSAQPSSVIHHGVSKTHFTGEPSVTVKAITKDPFLLYVGGIDIRKNVVSLVSTFYELKATYPSLKLVTVGKEFGLRDQLIDLGWFRELAKNVTYKKDVIAPGFLSDADLGFLYANARAFVFPSYYEGFGMPVLEAMQAGCPVVAYDNSSIPEVAGKAAIIIPDGQPLAPEIDKLITNKALREKLIAAGKKQAAKFAWEKTAAETLAILKKYAQ